MTSVVVEPEKKNVTTTERKAAKRRAAVTAYLQNKNSHKVNSGFSDTSFGGEAYLITY